MTVRDVLEEARKLSLEEQEELIQELQQTIRKVAHEAMSRKGIMDLYGAGSYAYDGTDAQKETCILQYRGIGASLKTNADPQDEISTMRDEWDK